MVKTTEQASGRSVCPSIHLPGRFSSRRRCETQRSARPKGEYYRRMHRGGGKETWHTEREVFHAPRKSPHERARPFLMRQFLGSERMTTEKKIPRFRACDVILQKASRYSMYLPKGENHPAKLSFEASGAHRGSLLLSSVALLSEFWVGERARAGGASSRFWHGRSLGSNISRPEEQLKKRFGFSLSSGAAALDTATVKPSQAKPSRTEPSRTATAVKRNEKPDNAKDQHHTPEKHQHHNHTLSQQSCLRQLPFV